MIRQVIRLWLIRLNKLLGIERKAKEMVLGLRGWGYLWQALFTRKTKENDKIYQNFKCFFGRMMKFWLNLKIIFCLMKK